MPQMAPLSWVMLFIIFSTLFIFSMAKMFFSKMNLPFTHDLNSETMNKSLMNWKW